VSDASTDRTDEIVNSYIGKNSWMQFVRKDDRAGSSFSSIVDTFNVGYSHLHDVSYDFIGKLDADMQLPVHYYETILNKFQENPRLGVAEGKAIEYYGDMIRKQVYKKNGVGSIHVFRRECFEAIGGYFDTKEGGEDTIAEALVRMKGWETKTFCDVYAYHLKPTNLVAGSLVQRQRQLGRREYFCGNPLLFEVLKCCFKIAERPYVIGAMARLSAYLKLWVRRTQRNLPDDVIRFIGQEQLNRLFPFLNLFRKR
jgi:cellulose synthase/poly-beta-1,6-N-acetylglucosamine synthase-like glycosyltransferase